MENNSSQYVFYKTRELTILQKLATAYWIRPKSYFLDEICLQDGVLFVNAKMDIVLALQPIWLSLSIKMMKAGIKHIFLVIMV